MRSEDKNTLWERRWGRTVQELKADAPHLKRIMQMHLYRLIRS